MEHNKATASRALDTLFSSVTAFSDETKFILVKAEDCTLYIPVNNLDISKIHEFRNKFKVIYDLTQGL